MFELICNAGLFVFLVYTYFTHVIEAKIPKSYLKNPNVIHPSAWPKAIIILLLICLAVNMYKIGMLILIAASLLLETLGFVVTAALLMFSYGLLLGEKKVWRMALISVAVALLMHILFSGLLDVTLPRGEIPFLRNFALFLENLF